MPSGRVWGVQRTMFDLQRPNCLQNALTALGQTMREVNAAIEEMRREHDPLASHIFVWRRNYRNVHDTKSGKTERRAKPQNGSSPDKPQGNQLVLRDLTPLAKIESRVLRKK